MKKITLDELYNSLDSLGYDVAYDHFKKSPKFPFIAYYEDERAYVYADNANYSEAKHIVMEVYTERRDDDVIQKIEIILMEKGIAYTFIPFLWIEKEKMYMSTFGFTL